MNVPKVDVPADDSHNQVPVAPVLQTASVISSRRRAVKSVLVDPLDHYLGKLYDSSLLTLEEEIDLFTRLAQGETGLRAKIIEANLRLVVSIAKSYRRFARGHFEDMIQSGNMALVKAVDDFDLFFGTRFSTYATDCIDGAIKTYRGNKEQLIRIKGAGLKQRQSIRDAETQFIIQHKRNPTMTELVEITGISELEIHTLTQVRSLASIHVDEDNRKIDIVDPDEDEWKQGDSDINMNIEIIREVLGRFPTGAAGLGGDYRSIIGHYYGFVGYEKLGKKVLQEYDIDIGQLRRLVRMFIGYIREHYAHNDIEIPDAADVEPEVRRFTPL